MSEERLWRRGGWGGLLAVLLLLAGCRDAGAGNSGIVELKAFRHAVRLQDGTSATWYAGKEPWNFASFLNAG